MSGQVKHQAEFESAQNARVPTGTKKEKQKYRREEDDGRDTKEYRAWINMRARCHNKSCKPYPNYGGRGITISKEWVDSFEAFVDDMGLAPGPEFTLERKDNSSGYSKENCKWASWTEQNNNTRKTTKVTYMGVTHSVTVWGRITKISRYTIALRLKLGWSIEKALTTPVIPVSDRKRVNGLFVKNS